MKVVKSLDELRRLALATGAEVLTPAGRFNSQRTQVAPLPAPRAVPVPAAPVIAPAAALATPSAAPASVAAVALLPAAPLPAPRQWAFAITYDADGAITHVVARCEP